MNELRKLAEKWYGKTTDDPAVDMAKDECAVELAAILDKRDAQPHERIAELEGAVRYFRIWGMNGSKRKPDYDDGYGVAMDECADYIEAIIAKAALNNTDTP